MSFLNDKTIQEQLDRFIGPLESDERGKDGRPKGLQPSSYELRLGEEVFLSSEKKLVRLGQNQFETAIKPGDFAILLTYESVTIPPDLMALISIKTSFKNMGLVNISGFHVDPGWKGKLTFSVYNAGPGEIILRYKEFTFIIFLIRLVDECEKPYDGEHQNQDQIPSRAMNMLTGKPVSPFELESKLQKLEHYVKIQWGLLVALTIGLMVAFIKALL
ncbi:MAG TPA: hypothetical protein VMW89_06110 [Desulfatiglandales bacterium]|nr:hypothetical protein [Desulfatiglandales bacterium]